MGSGKGSVRRTQATPTRPRPRPRRRAVALVPVPGSGEPTVRCLEERWAAHTLQSGVSELRAAQYYLNVGIRPGVFLTDDEKTRMINELYHDAVDCGALVLPASTADDFSWTIKNNPTYTGLPGGGTDALAPVHADLDASSSRVFRENYLKGRFDHKVKVGELGIMIHYLSRCLAPAMDARLVADWDKDLPW